MKQEYHGDINKYNQVESVLLFSGIESTTPEISFCIPAYKRAGTLQETLNSIIHQHFDFCYEIIVCDNSADISEENAVLAVVREYNNYPIRLFVNKENLGMTGNWNRLIELARGEIISFIHDDDMLAGSYGMLANSVLEKIKKQKLKSFGFLKVRFQEFRDGNELPTILNAGTKVRQTKLYDSLISGIGPTTTPTCGMMFCREALIAVEGFKEEYYPCADHIIGFVLEERGYKGYITEGLHAFYRWGANESLNIKTQVQTYDRNTQIRHYFYQHNKGYHCFGSLFEKAQRYLNLQEIYNHCKKANPDVLLTDIDDKPFHVSILPISCLKALRISNVIFQKLRRGR